MFAGRSKECDSSEIELNVNVKEFVDQRLNGKWRNFLRFVQVASWNQL